MYSFFDFFVVLVVQNDRVNFLSSNISTELLQLFLDVVLIYIGHSLENFNMFVLITTLEVIMMLCVAVEAETYFPKTSFTLKHSSFDRIHSTTFTFETNVFDKTKQTSAMDMGPQCLFSLETKVVVRTHKSPPP